VFGLTSLKRTARLSMAEPLSVTRCVSLAERDGHAVLMDLRSGHYFGLDEVGTRIWQLVLANKTPVEIFCAIEAEYDAGPDQLRNDATVFLTTVISLGLACQ
jgi:hypothetical protein